jgi:TRAP-type C4-dicarboxylate transport system permease small subunit
MRKSLDLIYDGCGYLAALFMVGIIASIVAQMIWRARGITLDSTEVAGLCLAASTFFGLAHTYRHGGHVRINLLVDRLPAGTRRAVELGLCALGTAVVTFLAWNMTMLALQSYQFEDRTPGLLGILFWIPQSGVAAGLWTLALALADELVWLLQGRPARVTTQDEVDLDNPVA